MLQLKSLLIENSGPIEELSVDFKFTEDGLPKPLIFVGENGSGKTTALSFLIDSLLQFASTKFNNVLASEDMGRLFYRIRSNDIRVGSDSSVSHVKFQFDNKDLHYVDRVSNVSCDINQLRQKLGLPIDFSMTQKEKCEKSHSQKIEGIGEVFLDGSYIFFPSSRREVPHWLQERGLHQERYRNQQRFTTKLDKSLIVESAAEDIAAWIMDGLLDKLNNKHEVSGIDVANQILKEILEDPLAHFAIAPRNVWPRVQIYTGEDVDDDTKVSTRTLAIPSLANLSAGQSMLLSMFGTIASHGTLSQLRKLDEITGIVLIDEAEVYLHTHLQRNVLPKLIKLFPRIQFVISTHSPSFLMGMKDMFGVNGFQILDMPSGTPIDVDQFSEVGAAVDALRETKVFKNEIKSQIEEWRERPILIVEGKSDAIWINKLWETEKNSEPPFAVLIAKNCRYLRYLLEDAGFIDEVGDHQRVLGLFDFDAAYDDWNGCKAAYPNEEGSDETGLLRKHAVKSIYAGLLPIPEHRKKQAGKRFGGKSLFTIELYLTDEQLKAGNNFQFTPSLGDVDVVEFRGDKVSFADRLASNTEITPQFQKLLSLIENTLQV